MHYPDKTGRHEPYESRDSRADLWGPEAEMPPATRQHASIATQPRCVAKFKLANSLF